MARLTVTGGRASSAVFPARAFCVGVPFSTTHPRKKSKLSLPRLFSLSSNGIIGYGIVANIFFSSEAERRKQ